MNSLLDVTRLAFHFATPMESAGASFDDNQLLRSIASTATHQVTAVHTDRGIVALPSVGALDSQARVFKAEARRWFQIDKVLAARRHMFRVVGI